MTAPTGAPAPLVLVVDDTEGNRYAVSRLLRGAGYRVAEAATGREALALVGGGDGGERPRLVVLDINLPDMTGFEVVARLKADPQAAAIPVLHLTASYVRGEDQAQGLEAGADAYLTHPVEPVVLLATIRALLRATAAEAEARGLAAVWQATFDAISEPIFLLDEHGAVLRANTAGAALHAGPHGAAAAAELARLLGGADAGGVARGELVLGEQSFLVSLDPVAADAAPHGAVVGVLTDVTARRAHERERDRLLAETQEARAHAEAANRAKSDFLAVMSHELRTPLNAIGGYAELMELGIRGPVTEEQRHDLARIQRSQRSLLSLINDVLNFAKLESGSVQFAPQPVPVAEVLHAAAELLEPQVRDRGLRYAFELDGAPPLVHADPEKLQQVLLNLLTNALKFTPAGGTITLGCTAAGAMARVTVTDTGPGIPPDKRERVFEPFVQVDRRLTAGQQSVGVGLGLAISRDLARRMGGDLTAHASPAGTGAMFVLTVPITASDERRATSDE